MPISTDSSDWDLTPSLAQKVRNATARRTPLRIVGGDTKRFYGRPSTDEVLSVAEHRGVIVYEPTELVITARAGTPMIEIESLLAEQGQMLGFEPPIFGRASTIGGVVAAGLSGPRRPFAGAVRDFVLGVTVLNGRGDVLKFGGTVVKNVAGFDAFRLMAAALGCLGVLLDVSLRVVPRPRIERALSLRIAGADAATRLTALMRRPLPLSGAFHDGEHLQLRLSGTKAGVAQAASEIGGEDRPLGVWDDLRHMRLPLLTAPRLWRLSVPRRSDDLGIDGRWLYDWAGGQRWLVTEQTSDQVRAAVTTTGGHATLFRGAGPGEAVFTALSPPLLALHQRLKAAFDPARIFNPGRLYEEL